MQETTIRNLYEQLITGWNDRSATGMSTPFAADGELIGFDGSQIIGQDEIFSHLDEIFPHQEKTSLTLH